MDMLHVLHLFTQVGLKECVSDASLLLVEDGYVGLTNQVFNKTIFTTHVTARVKGIGLGVASVGQFIRVRVIIERKSMPYTRVEGYMVCLRMCSNRYAGH